jgi:hypothetical protein
MPVSEAKRASNAAWDADNMAYQTVKVRKTILEAFRAACAARGDKVNTVLREAMEAYTSGTLQHRRADSTREPLQRAEGLTLTPGDQARAEKAAEAEALDLGAWISRTIKETASREALTREVKSRTAAQTPSPAERFTQRRK